MNRLRAFFMTSALGLGWPAVVVVLLGVSACAELEKERQARIETSGGHALAVGQTLTVVATTVDGRDAAYDFVSLAPDVATVTEQGLVRGVAREKRSSP